MKKYISVNKESLQKLMKLFNVGERCVKNALVYRSNNELAKKIRFTAVKEYYGCTYALDMEDNLFFDSDGCMRQVFRTGVEIYLDKRSGEGFVYDRKGNVAQHYANVALTMIPEIQQFAATLK